MSQIRNNNMILNLQFLNQRIPMHTVSAITMKQYDGKSFTIFAECDFVRHTPSSDPTKKISSLQPHFSHKRGPHQGPENRMRALYLVLSTYCASDPSYSERAVIPLAVDFDFCSELYSDS